MANPAKQVAAPASQPVKLTAIDAARLAMKDVKAHNIETINAAGNTVAVNVNDPAVWQEMGTQAAMRDSADVAALAIARALLKDAKAPVWNAFSECFIAGAALTHKNPANLLHRLIYAPLKLEHIVKPISETSTNARKDAAGVTVAEKKKAAAETLAKIDDKVLVAEVEKAEPIRRAELLVEMARREKLKAKDASDAINKQKAAAKKSISDAMGLMSPAQMVVLLGFANAIIACSTNATALQQHCAKTLDAYDNALKGNKKGKAAKH